MEYLLIPLIFFIGLVYLTFPFIISHWLMDKVADFFSDRGYGFNFSVTMAVVAYIFVCSMYYGIPITFVLTSLATKVQ